MHLGERIPSGLGTEKNEKEALRWYFLAAEAGDKNAQFTIARNYLVLECLALRKIEGSGEMGI